MYFELGTYTKYFPFGVTTLFASLYHLEIRLFDKAKGKVVMKKAVDEKENILVICAQGMGNTLLAIPLIRMLRQKFPSKKISVIVWANSSEAVLQGLSEIDELYGMSTQQSRIKTLFVWGKRLRSVKYSNCVVAWPGGMFSALLALLSGARVRLGHKVGRFPLISNLFFTEVLDWKNNIQHDLERNLELAQLMDADISISKPMELFLSDSDCEFADRFLRESNCSVSNPVFGLMPGSGQSQKFKRWPIEYYIGLRFTIRFLFP